MGLDTEFVIIFALLCLLQGQGEFRRLWFHWQGPGIAASHWGCTLAHTELDPSSSWEAGPVSAKCIVRAEGGGWRMHISCCLNLYVSWQVSLLSGGKISIRWGKWWWRWCHNGEERGVLEIVQEASVKATDPEHLHEWSSGKSGGLIIFFFKI